LLDSGICLASSLSVAKNVSFIRCRPRIRGIRPARALYLHPVILEGTNPWQQE
jgi:hypothetical protein